MGIIRKTASIATLGLVNFRSKTERLNQAEELNELAADRITELETKSDKRTRKLSRAEKKLKKAELKVLAEAKKAKRERRRSSRSADSKVIGLTDAAVVKGRRAERKAKRAAKKAEKKARNVAKSAAQTVSDTADAAREAI